MATRADMTDLVPTLTIASDNRKTVPQVARALRSFKRYRALLAAGTFLATLWELGIFTRGFSDFSWFGLGVSVFVTLVVGLEREIRAGRFSEWWQSSSRNGRSGQSAPHR